MDKNTLEAICLRLAGTVHDYKEEWEADRYLIGNKMFAMIGGDAKGQSIITLKCDPNRSEELRKDYAGVVPGYYMNKTHWISIYFDSNLAIEHVEKLIAHSYSLVLESLPKKVQKEIHQLQEIH